MKTFAEVEYDEQHGPIVRVGVDDRIVAVYLADETGIVTLDDKQYGIQVTGSWVKFREGLKTLVEHHNVQNQ